MALCLARSPIFSTCARVHRTRYRLYVWWACLDVVCIGRTRGGEREACPSLHSSPCLPVCDSRTEKSYRGLSSRRSLSGRRASELLGGSCCRHTPPSTRPAAVALALVLTAGLLLRLSGPGTLGPLQPAPDALGHRAAPPAVEGVRHPGGHPGTASVAATRATSSSSGGGGAARHALSSARGRVAQSHTTWSGSVSYLSGQASRRRSSCRARMMSRSSSSASSNDTRRTCSSTRLGLPYPPNHTRSASFFAHLVRWLTIGKRSSSSVPQWRRAPRLEGTLARRGHGGERCRMRRSCPAITIWSWPITFSMLSKTLVSTCHTRAGVSGGGSRAGACDLAAAAARSLVA
eukprot:scaffold614_cov367-Prasinococcus_capsulatus_cf.AAC.35